MQRALNLREILSWYAEAGVDESIALVPGNHVQRKEDVAKDIKESAMPPQIPAASGRASASTSVPLIVSPSAAVMEARKLAEAARTLDELREALMKFDGCSLKKSAKNTVFADGNPNAKVMLIGEAPGENEDEQGIPFCGKSGQLLDNSLASIGLKRSENLYISNTIFWRPPGNRTPSPEEVAICAPFVKKHIALKNPSLLLLAGGVAGSLLGRSESVSALRRAPHRYHNEYLAKEIPAVVIYHPSYLLRQPGQKAAQWQDLLKVQEMLVRL